MGSEPILNPSPSPAFRSASHSVVAPPRRTSVRLVVAPRTARASLAGSVRVLGLALTYLVALTLFGCGHATPGRRGAPRAGRAGQAAAGPSGTAPTTRPSCSRRKAADVRASLPPERWQYLQAHALDEEYEPAELRFEGEAVGQVGLRFKGSVGTLTNCFDAEGEPTCRKLSMKLKFDEYAPDLRFYGLKRLNLHAMMHDASLVHEKLTYDLYRDLGVDGAAQQLGHRPSQRRLARPVFVGRGDRRSLHQRSLAGPRRRQPVQGGVAASAPIPEDYAAAIETNEETATHEAFAAFAAELQAAPDAAARRQALGRWTDSSLLARYMAVDDAIANIDGVTAIYCSPEDPSACGNHNYFFYLSEDQSRFQLVPWDLDATLWPQTSYDNVPPWHVTPESCDARYRVRNPTTHTGRARL